MLQKIKQVMRSRLSDHLVYQSPDNRGPVYTYGKGRRLNALIQGDDAVAGITLFDADPAVLRAIGEALIDISEEKT